MTTNLPLQFDPPLSPRQTLPTMYDLPSENPEEPGLPDEFHNYQPLLLRYTFKPTDVDSDEIFIGSDINVYYDTNHLNWYKRPDWFAVVGVSRLYEGQDLRNSYVIWQESVSPFVVVELLSPGTENEDLGRTVRERGNPPTKWQVYEQVLRVPYYIVFSRYTSELQAFRLVAGEYEAAELTNGRLLIPQLKLSLGLWEGSLENIERLWLRWFTLEGEMILTPTEESAVAQERAILAEQEAVEARQEVVEARQEVVEARQQAEKLAAKLRELGIDPNELS